MQVGEVAAPASGDQDFLAQPVRVFQNGNAPAAPARLYGAHQAGRASTENQRVKRMDHRKSHVEQAEPRQRIFFQQTLVHILLVQLFNLR